MLSIDIAFFVLIASATILAYLRSGEPLSPIANECNRGHQASSESFDSIRFLLYFAAIAEIIDESKIPDEYYIEKIETRLDKRRILEELKEGKEIPGVVLRKNKHVRGLK